MTVNESRTNRLRRLRIDFPCGCFPSRRRDDVCTWTAALIGESLIDYETLWVIPHLSSQNPDISHAAIPRCRGGGWSSVCMPALKILYYQGERCPCCVLNVSHLCPGYSGHTLSPRVTAQRRPSTPMTNNAIQSRHRGAVHQIQRGTGTDGTVSLADDLERTTADLVGISTSCRFRSTPGG